MQPDVDVETYERTDMVFINSYGSRAWQVAPQIEHHYGRGELNHPNGRGVPGHVGAA